VSKEKEVKKSAVFTGVTATIKITSDDKSDKKEDKKEK
jgi:hypothetical protein